MPDVVNKLVGRHELKSYMNTGTIASPVWSLIGEGFTALGESKNPKSYSRHYVHEKGERTDVMGYSPSIAFTADVYSADPVISKIMAIYNGELVGMDAQVEIVCVRTWEDGTSGNEATHRKYAVICDKLGDGVDALQVSGNFNAVSEVTTGEFAIATSIYTADT